MFPRQRVDGLFFVREWSEFRPGLDLRVGLSAAASHPPTFNRGGFNFGIRALLLLHPQTTLTWDSYQGSDAIQPMVTFTPMVVVGYDSR